MDSNSAEAARHELEVQRLASLTTEFYAAARSSDDLAVFLRLHLFFERALTDRITNAFQVKEAIDWDGLNAPEFILRCKMARALGIFTELDYSFAKRTARIRNELAHRLNRMLDEQDYIDLYRLVDREAQEVTDLLKAESAGTEQWQSRPLWLRGIISILWFKTVVLMVPTNLKDFLVLQIRNLNFLRGPISPQ